MSPKSLYTDKGRDQTEAWQCKSPVSETINIFLKNAKLGENLVKVFVKSQM